MISGLWSGNPPLEHLLKGRAKPTTMKRLWKCLNREHPGSGRGKGVTLRAAGGPIVTPSGFTVVELLVVIVLVAVLASLLFPFVGRIKNKADSAGCMSNLRQLTSAAMLYSSDSNGDLPMPTESDGVLAWPDTLAPYIGKERPFLTEESVKCCPTQFKINNQSRTYAINRQLDAKRQGLAANGAPARPLKMAAMSRPGERGTSLTAIPFFMDGRFTKNWKVHRAWPESTLNENNFPHDGRCNMSFLDGHAEATRPEDSIWSERSRFHDGAPSF